MTFQILFTRIPYEVAVDYVLRVEQRTLTRGED
jgi:hypothetical protein